MTSFYKTFMAKKIYIDRVKSHLNEYLANLIIDKQLPIWDKNDFCSYKKMYPLPKQ